MINHVFLDAVDFVAAAAKKKGDQRSITAPLDPQIVKSIGEAWKNGVELNKYSFNGVPLNGSNLEKYKKGQRIQDRTKEISEWKPVQDKYQCALILAGKSSFVEKDKELKSIRVLHQLRNYLIHHKPAWVIYSIPKERHFRESGEYDLANDLKEQLTNYATKYVKDPNNITNPLIPGSTSFPYIYLWSVCADWSIRSSWDFTVKFSSTMGLDWSKLGDPRYKKIRK